MGKSPLGGLCSLAVKFMNRTILNIVIDLVAALLFVGMIATGYLLRFPLPPGSNKTHVLWGLTRHQWGDVHFWISLGLLVTMLIHLGLHWNWIVTVIGKRCHLLKTSQPSLVRSAIWTVVIFTAICVAFGWMARRDVEEMAPSLQGTGAMHQRKHSRLPEPATAPPVKADSEHLVWKDIYPILEKHCLGCHGPQRQLAGFRVDVFQAFFGPDAKPPLIVARQSGFSPLIEIVSGQRPTMAMAESHKLAETDVARIRAWIDQGAE